MWHAYQQGFRALGQMLKRPFYMLTFIGLYLPVLWLFVYIAEFGAFTYVMGLDSLAFHEKAGFLLTSIANVFVHITDPLALSVVVFSVFAALNLVLIIYRLRNRQRGKTKGKAAAGLAVIGSHCIACGGSLLAPAVTALSGSSVYLSSARADIATAIVLSINIAALLLIMHATLKLAALTNPGTQSGQ